MQGEEKIRVGLVEDQILFRKGMKAILESWPDLEVVMEAAEGYSVVDLLNDTSPLPHVLLVDLSLPATPQGKTFSGLEVTKAVRGEYPEIKIIILSVHDDDNFIAELILNGAHGYLVKDSDPNEVHDAILAVHHHGSYINKRSLAALQKANTSPKEKPVLDGTIPLTKREIEILQLVCKEHTTEEIAEKLFISVKTVNGHRNNLLQKTGCRNVAGLFNFAIKNKLIEIS
ncbi:MAG: DNA-binding response regulator [Azospira oryzae]|jgi:two-component system response regulator NreC|nr:MAG: DNA-binding response regulator [Azospira oryzae]